MPRYRCWPRARRWPAREQARRIHERLAGVPPTEAVLDAWRRDVVAGRATDAANTAMQQNFYSVTLKNFAAPWTNRDQSVFVPLNDYTATVIGMVRDDVPFNTLLSGDLVYMGRSGAGVPAYSADEQRALPGAGGPGRRPEGTAGARPHRRRSSGMPDAATAGVMTTARPPRPSSSPAPTARCSASR